MSLCCIDTKHSISDSRGEKKKEQTAVLAENVSPLISQKNWRIKLATGQNQHWRSFCQIKLLLCFWKVVSVKHWLSLELKHRWLGATIAWNAKSQMTERRRDWRKKVTPIFCDLQQNEVLRQTLSVNSQTNPFQPTQQTQPHQNFSTHETFFCPKLYCDHHLLLSSQTASGKQTIFAEQSHRSLSR